MRKIVLDTDFGTDVDDALALALALACPDDLEVIAVTVCGKQSLFRSDITRQYLKLANREDIPVYAGSDCDMSLQRVYPIQSTPFNWFGNEGQATFPATQQLTAVDALVKIFSENRDIEIVAVGMMTNIAAALKASPNIAQNIKKITIMGGQLSHIQYHGSTFPFGIDYNMCSDPYAAMTVLYAGVPVVLVTADVTLKTWLTSADLDKLKKETLPQSTFMQMLIKDIENWRIFNDTPDTDNVAFLHDPLTLAAVLSHAPHFLSFQSLHIEPLIQLHKFSKDYVTEKEGDSRDWKLVLRTIPHSQAIEQVTKLIECATAVDPERFRDFFVNKLITRFGK